MNAQQACSRPSRPPVLSSPNVSIGRSLSLDWLKLLCSDMRRVRRGDLEIRAVLAFSPTEGFYLWAQDGPFMHPVMDRSGSRIKFRTIETALEEIRQVTGLSAEIAVVQFDLNPPGIEEAPSPRSTRVNRGFRAERPNQL